MSTLINRTDDFNAQVVKDVNTVLKNTKDFNIMDNESIDVSYLGRKGLHLSNRGVGKMVTNFQKLVKSLNSK